MQQQDTIPLLPAVVASPFYLGRTLTSTPPEQLQPVAAAELYRLVTQDLRLAQQVHELRHARALDARAYGQLKLRLPYFVGATFGPAQRHLRNFRHIGGLVLDFDHLPAAGHTSEALREQLRADARVWLAFVSPSGEGLKVVLGLSRPEHDAGRYAAFYRAFAANFAARYGLSDCLDGVTHDVARVCLLSHDPAAYFNPTPVLLEPEQEVDFGALVLEAGYRRPAKAPVVSATEALPPAGEDCLVFPIAASVPVVPVAMPVGAPSPGLLDELLHRLNPDRRPARAPALDPVQPLQLNGLAVEVTAAALAAGLGVGAITPISYGQCYRFELGRQFGEVNVFYGKRGYTLVKTTKSGSEPRLAEAGRAVLAALLFAEAPAAVLLPVSEELAPPF